MTQQRNCYSEIALSRHRFPRGPGPRRTNAAANTARTVAEFPGEGLAEVADTGIAQAGRHDFQRCLPAPQVCLGGLQTPRGQVGENGPPKRILEALVLRKGAGPEWH